MVGFGDDHEMGWAEWGNVHWIKMCFQVIDKLRELFFPFQNFHYFLPFNLLGGNGAADRVLGTAVVEPDRELEDDLGLDYTEEWS